MRGHGTILSLFSIAALAGSCNSDTKLALSISNIPVDTESVNISIKIDEKSYDVEPLRFGSTDNNGTSKNALSGITIPFGFNNKQIDIKTTAISKLGNKCPTAEWSGSIGAIEPGTYSVSVPLQNIINDDIRNDLFSVATISATEAWAVGTSGTVVKWDGCYWRRKDFLAEKPGLAINKIYYHANIGLIALGNDGTIAKYNTQSLTWNEIDLSSIIGTGENLQSIIWTGITYLEGSTGDFLILGSAVNKLITNGEAQCFAARLSPAGTTYQATRISSPFCPTYPKFITSPPVCNQFGSTNSASSCNFVASSAYSFPPDRIVISGTAYIPSQNTAFIVLDNKLQQIPSAPNPMWVPSISSANTYGTPGTVWGTSINDFWLGSNHFFRIMNSTTSPSAPTNKPIATETELYKNNTDQMKVISIIGFGAKDFWTIGFPNSRFSQVNHFIDKPGLALDYSNIGILKYNTGIDNYPITHMSAVSNNDIWFVGYGGIRIHYNGTNFQVYR